MILKTYYTSQFKKDLKLCSKRQYNMRLLSDIVETLQQGGKLEQKNRDHLLSGNFTGHRECHIEPDWLLIYIVKENEIWFVRTGTHSDLFNK